MISKLKKTCVNNCLNCNYSKDVGKCFSCNRPLISEDRVSNIDLGKILLECPCHSSKDEVVLERYADDGLFKPDMEFYLRYIRDHIL